MPRPRLSRGDFYTEVHKSGGWQVVGSASQKLGPAMEKAQAEALRQRKRTRVTRSDRTVVEFDAKGNRIDKN